MNRKICCKMTALAALLCSSMANADDHSPKNIIYIIADGMGPAYTTAYRNYMDDPATAKMENTVFDQLLVGMASTYSLSTDKDHTAKTTITDSAAAATALSSGVKTYNRAVAVDVNGQPLQTLMEHAKSLGKTTGLVVTSQINHATPAAFVAHNAHRHNYNAIADDYFDNRVNGRFVADLMFGGGQKYFVRQDRDIVNEFTRAGYQYFDQLQQLGQFDRLPALGLFADKGIGYAIDNQGDNQGGNRGEGRQAGHRLQKMVAKALSLMETAGKKHGKGYFLLIEASLIDWCGHANDIACAMHEMDDLAEVLRYLTARLQQRNDTLMVVTADHNTGGLSIGSHGQYHWKPRLIRQINHSIDASVKQLLEHQDPAEFWQQNFAIAISPAQLARLAQAQQQVLAAIKDAKLAATADHSAVKAVEEAEERGEKQLAELLAALTAEITHTGWTTGGHTGGDVQVFAYGKGKARFNGHQDNTAIAKKLFSLMQ